MSRPVFVLAFANNRDDYLPLVTRERKNITRTLRTHDDKGRLKVIAEASSTLEDIFEYFQAYANEVTIFHFGGHADGVKLFLEDAKTESVSVNGKGLAKLLGEQDSLELVFLNGCATKAQVELLFSEGVKAVIATSIPVGDQMATEFAEQFYNALASHANIERSFKVASAFLEAKYNYKNPVEVFRGQGFIGHEQGAKLPWGLYINDQAGGESTLKWSLPRVTSKSQSIKNRFDYETSVDVNDILIETMCGEVAKYNEDLSYELDKEYLDIPSIKREIVDSFPTPIGEQLRKLFTRSNNHDDPDPMETFSIPRLYQIIQTYRTTTQFICFTILSQLWDVKYERKDAKIDIDEDFIVAFNSFFALNKENFKLFDFVKFISTITDLFDKYSITYFIEELKDVKIDIDENPALYEAYVFLNSLYEDLIDGSLDNNNDKALEVLGQEAEYHLGIILGEFAFLATYKLATIKGIELIKSRHEPARFRHVHIVLNQALTVASTGVTEVGIEFDNYTDTKSVLFLKTAKKEIKDYLNLTPFIIDENALKNDFSTKLYLYGFEDSGDYCYNFLYNLEDPPLRINSDLYPSIKRQFDRFKAEIFGHKYQPDQPEEKKTKGGRFIGRKKLNK